ncbi:major capsid protein [Pseudochrobactrum sp. HB0163]|uniref:major capsid protein n=1 Tax=Pseudochrobactrum sp. HB0163 TaxID=3450708 RepID=UPI003F6E3B69
MDLFSTAALLTVIESRDRPTAFIRDTFFPNGFQSDQEEIAFDKLKRRRNVAPFVSPLVPGKERAIRGRQTSTFTPAYVKPKNTVRPGEGFRRRPGESLYGNMSAEERYLQTITDILADQDDEVTRREEVMAAEALRTGKIVVSGEDYETQIVDYNRPANHTIALTGTDRWGENGVSVRKSIREWATRVATTSGGAATEVILGAEAAELLQGDPEIREILDNRRQMGGEMQFGPVAAGSEDMVAVYLGSVGQFNFWQYTQLFQDDDGNDIEVWPSFGVGVIAPSQFQGFMAHGAIQDIGAQMKPLSRYPKMWNVDDPSATFLMTQSAPLPVPGDASASLFAMVR